MKSQVILISGFALFLAACAGGGSTAPESEDEMQMASQASGGSPRTEAQPTKAFIAHMHLHADQLDKINFALADGDLYGAMTPAYWLSRHEDVSGVPVEWQPYLRGMRSAAFAVESANDLTEARAAAMRLNAQCQGCHAAAGVR